MTSKPMKRKTTKKGTPTAFLGWMAFYPDGRPFMYECCAVGESFRIMTKRKHARDHWQNKDVRKVLITIVEK